MDLSCSLVSPEQSTLLLGQRCAINTGSRDLCPAASPQNLCFVCIWGWRASGKGEGCCFRVFILYHMLWRYSQSKIKRQLLHYWKQELGTHFCDHEWIKTWEKISQLMGLGITMFLQYLLFQNKSKTEDVFRPLTCLGPFVGHLHESCSGKRTQ